MAGMKVLKGLLFICALVLFIAVGPAKADWPMAGANPQRTSWVPEEVKGVLRVNWYRPIEAFIQGKVNLIAASDRIYISTARGLIILNYDDGSVAGRFDTQIPLGNAPTIVDSCAYVPGLDRTIYKLNALDGSYIDSFTGAKAGFHGNPLVINDSFTDNNDVIFVGSRDGYLYAIDADTMDKLWQYPAEGQPPLGPIAMSPAYNNGVIYFVANNTLRMYAVDSGGNLLWVSPVLKGMQYQSYWPVIFQDKVMVFGSPPYSHGTDIPGMGVITNLEGTPFNTYQTMQAYMMTRALYDTMPVVSDPCGTWHHGQTVYDGWRYSEYYEDNPEYDFYWHKPFRRLLMIINSADGSEYTCDVDEDGFGDYAPIYYHGTRSGNASPPMVGPDGVIYFCNYYNDTGVSHVRMMGWLFGTRYLSSISWLRTAFDEPTILSGGGTVIYRVLCCDREAVWADVDGGTGTLWSYSLSSQAPGYGIMWYDRSGESGLWGGYANVNGIYHDHGDQNPLIPYNGKLYVHRSNCIICYGSDAPVTTPLPLIELNDEKEDIIAAPTVNDLKARLESEIQKIVDAGNLKPGYYNRGQAQPNWYDNYFVNPGDTLHVLLRAYPYIDNATLKTQLEAYLQGQWSEYFNPTMYAEKGWSEGAYREDIDYPPDLADSMTTIYKRETTSSGWGWTYPQRNFYAMWKYAQLFPSETANAYNLAKSKITLPPLATDATMLEQPWIVHGYVAGYYGFLELQTLAGQEGDSVSGWTRTQIQNELNRLLQLRVNGFEKDTPWNNDNRRHWKRYNIARNFMWLTPEIGDYMYQHIYGQVQEAMDEYNWVAAYSFLSRFEADTQEGCMGVLDTYNALFQARAYALKESYEELTKYLDVPAFPRGDLFYIDNLIAAIEAPHAAPEITPDGGGTYIDPVTVEIAIPTVPDANIYYTLDGSEPNSNCTLYTGPLVLSSSATVKAVAYYLGEPGMVATAVFAIDTGLANQAPVVNAGPDQETAFPDNFADLAGSYTDNTLTFPPTTVTTSWSRVTGPGTVVFDDASQLETTATFPVVGVYTLRLSADEGGLVGTDDIVITVLPKPNEAPLVEAGPDQQIVLPNTIINLDGTVTDDALPDPPATVTATWTAVSGPAPVAFADIYAVDTTATFTSSGTYVLRLSAYDGEYDANDTMTVTVLPPVSPGVVCHLKLDDGAGTTAIDSSNYGNNGAISGANWMSDGADSNCLSFNGTNAVLLVPSTYHFDSAKGTWSLWVRTDGVWGVDGGSGGITEQGTAALMVRHNSSASRSGLTVCLNSTGTVGFQAKSASVAVLGIGSTDTIIDNTWHHVAVTWDQAAGGQMKIYIDGSPDGSGTNSDAWTFNNQAVRIADSTDTYWEEFAGQIDDVQIYNIVLSDADMATLYNNAGHAKKAGDINSSGAVDEVDLGLMAAQWLLAPGTPSADICPPPDGDGNVDLLDMAVLANDWLD